MVARFGDRLLLLYGFQKQSEGMSVGAGKCLRSDRAASGLCIRAVIAGSFNPDFVFVLCRISKADWAEGAVPCATGLTVLVGPIINISAWPKSVWKSASKKEKRNIIKSWG
jgi:hypothetical protein